MTVTKRPPTDAWQRLCRKTSRLCQAAYNSAMRNEPYSEFPGVDIDAIHDKMKGNYILNSRGKK